MTKKIQSNKELLEKLKHARLKTYTANDFKRYMVGEDEYDWWKRPKKDSVVYSFFVKVYCVRYRRLLERTFYIEQKWENKQKTSKLWEVQRTLAGVDKKLNRRVYYSMNSTVKVYTSDYLDYYHRSKNITPDTWEIVNINTRRIGDIVGCGYYSAPDVYIYNDCRSLLKQTIHKYSGFEYSQEFTNSEIFEYLAMYDKHPQVEMISKMGLSYLLKEDLRCFRFSKTGYEIFGIEKEDFKYLQALKMPLPEFRRNITYIRKFNILTQDGYRALRYLLSCRDYIPITKYNYDYVLSLEGGAYLYHDYLRFCNQLGLPFNHENKYPKNIKKAHDELMNKIEVVKNKEKEEAIINRVIKELSKYRYADEKLIITPANSIEDLIEESKELDHCVRTYANRYAEGETAIFLIRKQQDVNTPYFTLELKNKNICQVRGKHNCVPDKDVIDLLHVWADKFKLKGVYV